MTLLNVKEKHNTTFLILIMLVLPLTSQDTSNTTGSDLSIKKINKSNMEIEYPAADEHLAFKSHNVGKLVNPTYKIHKEDAGQIQFTTNSDTRLMATSFTTGCNVPILAMNYGFYPIATNGGSTLQITAEFFGFSSYNALNEGESITFSNYKQNDFSNMNKLMNQQIIINDFVDKVMHFSVFCLAFSDPANPSFEFKIDLKASDKAVEETFDLKEFVVVDKTISVSKDFTISPNTTHLIRFINLFDQTSLTFSHMSNHFLEISIIDTDKEGNIQKTVYSEENLGLFKEISTNDVVIEFVNKTAAIEADISIDLVSRYDTILGMKVFVFYIVLSIVSLIIISLVVFFFFKCKSFKKVHERKKAPKAKLTAKEMALDLAHKEYGNDEKGQEKIIIDENTQALNTHNNSINMGNEREPLSNVKPNTKSQFSKKDDPKDKENKK